MTLHFPKADHFPNGPVLYYVTTVPSLNDNSSPYFDFTDKDGCFYQFRKQDILRLSAFPSVACSGSIPGMYGSITAGNPLITTNTTPTVTTTSKPVPSSSADDFQAIRDAMMKKGIN